MVRLMRMYSGIPKIMTSEPIAKTEEKIEKVESNGNKRKAEEEVGGEAKKAKEE